MLYYGGKVIPNAKVYVVNWTSAVVLAGDLAGFYDTVLNSNYLDWLNEYNTTINTTAPSPPSTVPLNSPGTNQLIGRGVYANTFTIRPSSANAGGTVKCSTTVTTNCCPPVVPEVPSDFTCLTDGQIEAELNAQIIAGALPAPDENSLYMAYFPPKYLISNGTAYSCRNGGFCGYHSTFKDATREFYYGVLPDHGPDSGGCDLGCGNGGLAWQSLTANSGHELAEAITDPEVGLNQDATTSWYDPGDNDKRQNGEVGDMCVRYNAVVGVYTVQSIYSNFASLCVPSRVAASDFSVSLASNKKVLAGGGSVTVPVTTAPTGTDGAAVGLTLSISGLPAHVTGSFDNPSLTSGNGALLTLHADPTATAVKGAVVQVKAVAGGNVHTAGLLLVVVPAGASTASNFSLSLSSASTSARQGQAGTVTVTSASTAGVPEVVALSISALPTGVTAQFSPTTVMAGGSAVLTLFADASAPLATNVPFTVGGTSASASRSTNGTVTVAPPPTPPTASISHPANGAAVSGVVEVDATATPGSGATLTQMNLLVDGASAATVASSPAHFTWRSNSVADGPHALVVQSVDSTLATGLSAIVNVNVNNAPPKPSQKGGCASEGAGLAALLGLLAIRRRWRVT
jgi:hypothetical protein